MNVQVIHVRVEELVMTVLTASFAYVLMDFGATTVKVT